MVRNIASLIKELSGGAARKDRRKKKRRRGKCAEIPPEIPPAPPAEQNWAGLSQIQPLLSEKDPSSLLLDRSAVDRGKQN